MGCNAMVKGVRSNNVVDVGLKNFLIQATLLSFKAPKNRISTFQEEADDRSSNRCAMQFDDQPGPMLFQSSGGAAQKSLFRPLNVDFYDLWYRDCAQFYQCIKGRNGYSFCSWFKAVLFARLTRLSARNDI